jgi:AcrR family transcriptional regulator
MGIAERKEREKKEMRSLVLETAMELFLSEGFEKVTLRRIAKEIEYSPATIYLYFKDKDEILFALHTMCFDKLFAEQQTVLSIKDPWQRLRRHGKVYVSFALKNQEYYDLMFIMRGPAKKIKELEHWEAGLRSYEFLKENVQDCMDAGYLMKINPDVAAFAFWSLTHGVASLIIRERGIMLPEDHLEAIVEGALDFIMESIEKK